MLEVIWSVALALVLAVVALIMAGCGASAAVAAGSPRPTLTPTPHLPSPLTQRPCPGPMGSELPPSSGVVIVTPATPNHTATARVGQLVEIQLPTRNDLVFWKYGADMSDTTGLSLTQPAGIEDGQRDLCVWLFTAQSAGTATLKFTGGAICRPNLDCPQYLLLSIFTITVV